ncbi:polycomb protein suz12-B isoform X2 [Zootermopsis nevadensis]|uniref:polycomb protein suz12-B isoform X2 n=1 Tax=Zootermopsis nevadensis TaxID=136037 RepID=UPI000B8E5AC5|nr:polycomb protein suz12-B isoform X2 [Zootermopsis nevadensis]
MHHRGRGGKTTQSSLWKPTQIYRFLRTRNMLSPVFLNRTLSYMKQRMSRSHKHRKGFKVDCLLDRINMKNREIRPGNLEGYMTLTFLGFYDKKVDTHQEPVKVETLLLKICHKKRKDVSSPIMQMTVGTSEVPINPSEDHPPPKAPTISIPTESFNLSNGHLVKSYVLLLRVSCMSNGLLMPNGDVDMEPAQKRRKSSGPLKGTVEETKLFGSELIVYDKHNRCLLTDGDYELVLQEVQANVKGSPKKLSSWESIGEIKEECGPFEVFSKGPTLKFHLSWTTEPSNGLVDRPKPLCPQDHSLDSSSNKENRPERCNNNNNNNSSNMNISNGNSSSGSITNGTTITATGSSGRVCQVEEPQRLQIVYQFLYNNNSRQQTEACEDLHCPWCSLDCVSLYALLKHLKLCHSRFTFTYVPIPQGARIDVAINECYDGSYTGSPHDLISQPPGFAFSRNGPVRRTSVSNILVCRPKRPKPSLSEFLELDENEFDGQRPYITGHNRLYHHTTTCLPIYPKEMDVDSEGEHDPKWLQTKTMMMIDDFTDVNEGEKELMKMWNLHVMKHGYVGDCQIPLACTMFLEARGQELLLKNLYRNFVLHMCSLFDFGLVSPVTLYTTIQRLQDLIGESGEVKEILQNSWQAQRRHWLAGGCSGQNSQQEKTGSGDTSIRRKTMTQSLQMAGIQQHGTTKGQVISMHGQGRKSTQLSCNSLHKGQASSNSVDSSQPKRKSTQATAQQSLPLGNIQHNSLKGQTSVGSGDSAVMLQQRRKSASSLVSQANVNGSESLLMQQRRRSLGPQNSTIQNQSEIVPPLRRKSFHQLTSTSDQIGSKNQVVASHNSQDLMSSRVSEVAAVSHRRKSTPGQSPDISHMHSNHSSKSNGS